MRPGSNARGAGPSPDEGPTSKTEPAGAPSFADAITEDLVFDAAEALRLIRSPKAAPAPVEGIRLEDLGIATGSNPSPAAPPALRPGPASPEPFEAPEDTLQEGPPRAAEQEETDAGDTDDLPT